MATHSSVLDRIMLAGCSPWGHKTRQIQPSKHARSRIASLVTLGSWAGCLTDNTRIGKQTTWACSLPILVAVLFVYCLFYKIVSCIFKCVTEPLIK